MRSRVESSGTSPSAASGESSQLSRVFAANWDSLDLYRALGVLCVMLIPLIVSIATGEEKYWLSAAFGALFVGLSDQGGDFSKRVTRMGIIGVIGAVLTLLGFGIGTHGWGLVVLASFVLTLVAGLAVKFGVHRFRHRVSAQRLVHHLRRPAGHLRPGGGRHPRRAPGACPTGGVSPVDRGGRCSLAGERPWVAALPIPGDPRRYRSSATRSSACRTRSPVWGSA